MNTNDRPFIVGMGGTPAPNSSSERALRVALGETARLGADTALFAGPSLLLPMYAPGIAGGELQPRELVAALRRADGIIMSSPSYHGGPSGLLTNALDDTEEMRDGDRPYFEGRAVGLIVCVQGWQAVGTTLTSMRSLVHALRGWPTPLGVGINTSAGGLSTDHCQSEQDVSLQLKKLAEQVVWFARQSASQQKAA